MGWIITAVVLFGLAILPLGVSVIYDSEGARASLKLWVFRFPVYPSAKKKKKAGNPAFFLYPCIQK